MAPALQTLDEFEIVAVASRSKKLAEEYKTRFNPRHAFDDPQALIESPNVDLVVILAPAPETRAARQSRDRRRQRCL